MFGKPGAGRWPLGSRVSGGIQRPEPGSGTLAVEVQKVIADAGTGLVSI